MQRVKKYLWTKGVSIPLLTKAWWSLYHLVNRNQVLDKGRHNRISLSPEAGCLKNVNFDIEGDENTVVVSKGVSLTNLTVKIKGSHNRLIIEKNCVIAGGFFSFEDYSGRISVGKDTSILGVHLVVSEPGSVISIGADCMFSFDIDIRTGDSHSIIELDSGDRINYAEDVKIGSHVWLGAHVQILKGVSIGDDCVVGTGAVVTNDIPANSIAVGIPARVSRSGVTWHREKVYLKDNKMPELNPQFQWAWYDRGEALRKSGYYEEAISSFDQALKLNPDDCHSWRGRGLALAEMGRYSEAVASYDAALTKETNDFDILYAKAIALIKLGLVNHAIASLHQLLEQSNGLYGAQLRTDPAFADIRNVEQFRALV